MSPAKTAALIEMLLGAMGRVDPRNAVLDGGPDPLMGKDGFGSCSAS